MRVERYMPKAAILGLVIATGLAGCSNQGLRNVQQQGEGPDEFMVMPANPLSPPPSFTTLPPPTPGGANLADRDPIEEAVVSLGGRVPSASGGVPGSDAALVAAASRYGVPANARSVIQAEDDEFLARQQRWQGWRLVDRYDDVYRDQWLNSTAETERFRRSGVPVSSGPPAP